MALPDSGAIPTSMRYSEVVPRGIKADNNFVEFLPSNGSTFVENQIVRIPIQAFSQFLDTSHSYLKFNANVSIGANSLAGNIVVFDGGAAGLISRLRVLSASNVELERIDDYGSLSALMNDITRSTGNTLTSAISEGTAATTEATGHLDMRSQRNATLVAGAPIVSTFCLPLHLSGVLGPLMRKYLPLPIINNGIVLEFMLAPASTAFFNQNADGAVIYNVSDIKYVAALVTPPNDFMAMFRQVTQQSGLTISSTSFRTYISQLPAANAQHTIKIVDSLKSVKSVFTIMRGVALLNDLQHPSITARGKHGASSFFTRINNIPVPSAPIQLDDALGAQALTELRKSMAKLGDGIHGGGITIKSYIVNNDATASMGGADISHGAKFALGLDLEAFQNEALISGVSMYANNTSEIQVIIHANGAVVGGVQVNNFLLHDLELVIDNVGNVTVNC